MPLSRRQTLTVVAITAAAAMPASAAKAATQPIFTVFVTSPDDRGTLMVGVACAVPVASVTARVTDNRGVVVARYQLTLGVGSDARNGTWYTPQLTGIALGTYTISYEATSQDGGVSSGQTELLLWLQPQFTLEPTPPRISPTQPTVTVDGTVMGKHPVTQAVTPIAALPLLLVADHFDPDLPDPSPIAVTSAADGRFTGRFTLAGESSLRVSTNAPERETFVAEKTFYGDSVRAERIPIRITPHIDATHLNAGQPSTLDGLLEQRSQDRWVPMASRPLAVAFFVQGSSQGAQWRQVFTNSQGGFQLTTTPPEWGVWMVRFDKAPFYDETTATSQVVYVREPVQFQDVNASRTTRPDDGGTWQISGRVSNRRFPPTVVIQFRPTPAGAWQELGRVVADTSVGSPFWAFRAEFRPPGAGQLRAYCAAGDFTQEAVSNTFTVFMGPIKTPPHKSPDVHPVPPQPLTPGMRNHAPVRPTRR